MAALVASVCVFAGCERKTVVVSDAPPAEPVAKTKTFETAALDAAIDSFERAPTNENAADVRKAMAELDGEIAELEGEAARESGEERAEALKKLANLKTYREAEAARFAKAQAGKTPVVVDDRSGAQKAEDAAKEAGVAVKEAAEKTGEALKEAAQETGEAIRDAVR